jgi:hypothetical protein
MNVDLYDLFGVPPEGFQSIPFITSWFIPTWLLASIRLFLSIYSFTAIIFSFKWFADHTVIFHLEDIKTKAIVFPVGAEGIRQSFSYFTYLTFWGLAFYFWFAALHGFVYVRRGYTWLDHWPRYLQAMHTVYYSTVVCFPLLVTTVYWGSMWAREWWSDDFSQWNMITMHAMNSVFAGFEIIVTETSPLPIAHLSALLLIMSLYLGIAYITKATEGIYIYLWLDPKNGIAKLLLHVVGYGALLIGFFFAVRFAIILRCRWTHKKQQKYPTSPLPSPAISSFPSGIRPKSISQESLFSRRSIRQSAALESYFYNHPRPLSSSQDTLFSSKSRPESSRDSLLMRKLRPSSSQNNVFWSYERYQKELLREESENQLRLSLDRLSRPPSIQIRPRTGRSDTGVSTYSRATTMVGAPTSPLAVEFDSECVRRCEGDTGWPLPSPSIVKIRDFSRD